MTTELSVPTGCDRVLTIRRVAGAAIILGLVGMSLLVVSSVWTNGGRPFVGSPDGLALGTVAASGYIPSAIRSAETECERLRQERDAFDEFTAAVESIAVPVECTGGVPPVGVGRATAGHRTLSDVRKAYRETVMDLDHYDRDYGEGLYENMCSELSEHVATAVVDGHQFSQPLKQAVIQQSLIARSRRESLLETVGTEREWLERTMRVVREIDATLEDEAVPSDSTLSVLFDSERRLVQWQKQCERLIRVRQQYIHSEGGLRSKPDDPLLQTYLYEFLEVEFPVLATVTEQYERLQEQRRAIHREITYR